MVAEGSAELPVKPLRVTRAVSQLMEQRGGEFLLAGEVLLVRHPDPVGRPVVECAVTAEADADALRLDVPGSHIIEVARHRAPALLTAPLWHPVGLRVVEHRPDLGYEERLVLARLVVLLDDHPPEHDPRPALALADAAPVDRSYVRERAPARILVPVDHHRHPERHDVLPAVDRARRGVLHVVRRRGLPGLFPGGELSVQDQGHEAVRHVLIPFRSPLTAADLLLSPSHFSPPCACPLLVK